MADVGEGMDDSDLRRLLMRYTGNEAGPVTETTRSFYLNKLKNLIRTQSIGNSSTRTSFRSRHESSINKKPYTCNGFSDYSNSSTNKGFSSDESDEEHSKSSKSSRIYDGDLTVSSSLARPSLRSSLKCTNSNETGHKIENQSNGWTIHKNLNSSDFPGMRSLEARGDPDRNSQNISFIVLAAGGLFFLTVAYMYLYCGYNAIVFNDPRDSFILCPKSGMPSDVCVKKQDLKEVQDLLASIIQMARIASGEHECDCRKHPFLTRAEVEDFVKSRSSLNPKVIFALVLSNLHWETKVYYEDDVVSTNSSQINFIGTNISRLPLLCRIKRAVMYAMSVIGIFSFVILACIIFKNLWKHHQAKKEIETKQMNEIMEKVIDILKRHCDLCELKPQNCQPWLPVLNIRDLIIPLEERKAQRMIWEKAIHNLRSRESRLAWKVEFIAGEECEVVRWIPLSLSKNHENGTCTKTWQGSAIGGDSPKKVINKLYPPLTNCLKIRNMFDLTVEVGDGWKTVVIDAILEKVGANHGIVHIMVDEQSKDGCVYVRCNDENSAGHAFTNLHGWWFDGRLVTVKYLRLHRFIERFPDTMDHNVPLRPSNTERLSLSVPAHSSILENS